MGIATNTSINTNAQRPTDSKMVVGANQEYATKSAIPAIYRYYGMRVYDLNDNIEYEMVTYEAANASVLERATVGINSTTPKLMLSTSSSELKILR